MYRRRAPHWVRNLDRRELHGLTGKLLREWQTGITDRQEWLLNACLSELSYRRRTAKFPEPRCTCEMCFSELEDQPGDV